MQKASKLYIIGNGFDIMHGMKTKYQDFYNWLLISERLYVIEGLQSVYSVEEDGEFLLWSNFEDALGKYDINVASEWSFENLNIAEISIGNPKVSYPPLFLETQLDDIVNDVFTKWVGQIPLSIERKLELPQDALYFTFNYTDTLEKLYNISQNSVLHIHGRLNNGDHLIIGHNNYREPLDFWDDSITFRENNERIQRIVNMNNLCKPIVENLNLHKAFFDAMATVEYVEIIGHSCAEIDYPYFKRIRESVDDDAKWVFNPYSADDEKRVNELIGYLQLKGNIYVKQSTCRESMILKRLLNYKSNKEVRNHISGFFYW